MATSTDLFLPDECWECVFKFLNKDEHDKDNSYLKSLSLVSKYFLSITNRLRFSIVAKSVSFTYLGLLFQRFPNITSLILHDSKEFLHQISRIPWKLKSLDLSRQRSIPADDLRTFSHNITTLTSLNCSNIGSIKSTDLLLIANCFPLLEELQLGRIAVFHDENNFIDGIKTLSLKLSKLRKVNLSAHSYMTDQLLFHLFYNCKHLQEAIIFDCFKITIAGIISALRERPKFRSLHFTNKSDNCSNLFAILSNCPSLTDIKMEYPYPYMPEESVDNFNSLMVVNPQLKSLCLASNTQLSDESILLFAFIFPNLQLLDLSYCNKISQGICQVLRGCCKIRHLNLAGCSKVNLLGMNFEVPNLEVLNLSHTQVNDAELHVISKSCRGLLQLLLRNCTYVYYTGVKHVLENCTQLREINLKGCYAVHPKVVSSMILSRPSLRKIFVPPRYRFNDGERELLSHGCLLC